MYNIGMSTLVESPRGDRMILRRPPSKQLLRLLKTRIAQNFEGNKGFAKIATNYSSYLSLAIALSVFTRDEIYLIQRIPQYERGVYLPGEDINRNSELEKTGYRREISIMKKLTGGYDHLLYYRMDLRSKYLNNETFADTNVLQYIPKKVFLIRPELVMEFDKENYISDEDALCKIIEERGMVIPEGAVPLDFLCLIFGKEEILKQMEDIKRRLGNDN